jgi:hypothetical protein
MEDIGKVVSRISARSLPTRRESSSVRQAYTDHLNLSDAIDLVHQMIQRYPNGGAQAGKGYIGSLAATLCSYPKSVAVACADLLTGVTATRDFLPTPASIIAWCEPRKSEMKQTIDKEEEIIDQLAERAELEVKCGYRPLLGHQLANILVRPHCPQYADVVEQAQREPGVALPDVHGLWVPEAWIVGAKFA